MWGDPVTTHVAGIVVFLALTFLYRLYPLVAEGTLSDLLIRMNDFADAVLADADILFEEIPDSDESHPQAMEILSQLKSETFPAAVLTVADRQPLVIPIPEDPEQVTTTFESLTSSPRRYFLSVALCYLFPADVFLLLAELKRVMSGPDLDDSRISFLIGFQYTLSHF